MIKHWREYFTVIDLRSSVCLSYQKEACNLILVDKYLLREEALDTERVFLQRKAQKDPIALSWSQKNPINKVEILNFEDH